MWDHHECEWRNVQHTQHARPAMGRRSIIIVIIIITVLLIEYCAWLRNSKIRMRNFAQESQNAIRTQNRHVCRGHKERALYDHTARHIPGGL